MLPLYYYKLEKNIFLGGQRAASGEREEEKDVKKEGKVVIRG